MSLPPEIDFAADREASPDRMNRAMAYLLSQVRLATALAPQIQTAIDDLRTAGLTRLADGLVPVFTQANDIAARLATIEAAWLADDRLGALLADVWAGVEQRFAAIDAAADAAGGFVDRLDRIDGTVAAMATSADTFFRGGF